MSRRAPRLDADAFSPVTVAVGGFGHPAVGESEASVLTDHRASP